MKNEIKNYDMVDFFKILACLCIVGIHTTALSDILSKDLFYYLQACIYRLAVPFFFVASGFFYGKKLCKNTENSVKEQLFKTVKRLVPPLLFWESANIFIEIVKQYFIKHIAIEKIILAVIKSIFFYPYGALWYVQALLVALVIITVCYKMNKMILCLIGSIVLYFLGLLANTYYFLTVGTFAQRIIDNYLKIFISARNGLFVGLFFTLCGVLFSFYQDKIYSLKYKKGILVILYFIFVLETVFVKNKISADDKSLFISFIFLIPVLFIVIMESQKVIRGAKILRNYSTGIYFMHKVVIHLWLIIGIVLNVNWLPTVEFLVVVVTCVFICAIGYKINNKYINLLIK